MAKTKGLGRGLDAFFGDDIKEVEEVVKPKKEKKYKEKERKERKKRNKEKKILCLDLVKNH